MSISPQNGHDQSMSENEYGNEYVKSTPGPETGPNLSKEPAGGPTTGSGAGQPVRRLERTRDGRMIAGVCSGFGDYLGVDANILRVALAVVTVFGGAGLLAYALGWLLIPETGRPTSILQDLINKQQRPQH